MTDENPGLLSNQQEPLQIESFIQALSNGLFKKHIEVQKMSHAIKLVLPFTVTGSFLENNTHLSNF